MEINNTAVRQSKQKLLAGLESLVSDVLQKNDISLIDLTALRKHARWLKYPDGRKILTYNGKPLVELWPLETKMEGTHFIASHKYRILSGEH